MTLAESYYENKFMIIRRLIPHYVAWFFIMVLAGCHPTDTDMPQPDAVPADLIATVKADSVITLTEQVDFSTVSETGQGPSGSLIRWDKNEASKKFKVLTYDQRSRLIGTLEHFNISHEVVKARYQGDYLAECFSAIRFDATSQPLSGLAPSQVMKYQYSANKRLQRVLHYTSLKGRFKLIESVQYEYDSKGQLQLTRLTYRPENARLTTTLRYWENGDCIREEGYLPGSYPYVNKYYYNQQSNPISHLNLWPVNQINEHYMVGSGGLGSAIQSSTDYEYQYDLQGRLSAMKSRDLINYDSNLWSEWGPINRFTYAP